MFTSEGRAAPVSLSPIRIPLALALVALGLMLAYVAARLLDGDCDGTTCQKIVRFFDMSEEANLPAWFSSTCWLLAAAVAGLVSAGTSETTRRWRWHWCGMTAICVFLSMDEAAFFHETFGTALGQSVAAETVLYYPWLLYGFVMVGLTGLVYLPFLLALPRGTALRIVLAAVVFVSGAIGVEMLGGASKAGAISLVSGQGWVIQIAVEETCEMLGIIALIHALLHHLAESRMQVTLRASEAPVAARRFRPQAMPGE